MFEEVTTLAVAVVIAGALLAVGVAVLTYFNPQQPVDHANAAFFPLVKPLNGTHVQLGVKPLADYVEVLEVTWSRGRSQGHAPVRLVARNATWLTYGGRPVAVPCGANVTVATRYGAASRALSFHVACLQKEPEARTDLTVLYQNLVTYASYVADYVVYRTTPVLTAYFGSGSFYVGFQNVGPFPYMAVQGNIRGEGRWPFDRNIRMVTLKPNETVKLHQTQSECSEHFYRWLNIYARWNDSLEIWVNNVVVYRGVAPNSVAKFKAPQGFDVVFDPAEGTLRFEYKACDGRTYVIKDTKDNPLDFELKRGSSVQWRGWAFLYSVPMPVSPLSVDERWNVMPAGAYVNSSGGFDLFAAVPPFEVYSIYAAHNGSGLVVRWGDPSCGFAERCIRVAFYPQPGTYYITVPPGITAVVSWGSDKIAISDSRAAVSGSLETPLALPVYWRYNLTGAYPYRLEAKIEIAERKVGEDGEFIFVEIISSGYLRLYLDGRLVAYDAFYGRTVVRRIEPPRGGSANRPNPVCVPQKTRTPMGQDHGNLDKREGGYYVEVYNKYKVREVGCGIDTEYDERVRVGAYTANSQSYHVHDGQNTCGYQRACNVGGQVICLPPNQNQCPNS